MKSTQLKRRAGVLLHISSLPNGNMGQDAYRFVDFLVEIGASVWQTLPLNMPHNDKSPYQCLSAHAGNIDFICLQKMAQNDQFAHLLMPQDLSNYQASPTPEHKQQLIAQAYVRLVDQPNCDAYTAYKKFCRKHAYWLSYFAYFLVLRQQFNQASWNTWPKSYKKPSIQTLNLLKKQHVMALQVIKFTQFMFFTQWLALKKYANQKGIVMFGDIPIFVAFDSADVWANPHLFKLDAQSNMKVVAGVPPDYFSTSGQRWGNPHYNWRAMKQENFKWWLARMSTQNSLFDMVRIDHFRGLESAWEIPANNDTAMQGTWVMAPGDALLTAIKMHFKKICLVAEDLGIITPQVIQLRVKHHLAGMKILQFAFGGGDDNAYLPHHVESLSVVYTGTHDNDTSLGWYEQLDEQAKIHLHSTLKTQTPNMPHALIDMALNTAAELAVIPMQDILGLGTAHRMNLPGTIGQNWTWQFTWSQLNSQNIAMIQSGIINSKRANKWH